MRRWLVALALMGVVSDAGAGEWDTPVLRGSNDFMPAAPSYPRWSGFYAGAQLGYGSSNFDFSKATQDLVAFSLRELALESEQHPSQWQVLGSSSSAGTTLGGFVGYNSQWDDVIFGVEFNYNRSNFSANAPLTPITRVTSAGGNTYLVTINGSASMQVTDFATARARAGYVMGNFMPYFMAGVALGRANVTRSATVSGTETTPPPSSIVTPFSFTETETRNGAFMYGYSAGLGIEMLVLPNLFVRGEYEYVRFSPLSNIAVSVNNVRVGAGVRF